MATTDASLRIDLDEAKAEIEQGNAVALDVVQPGAWTGLDGAVEGAVRILPDELEDRYAELPMELEIIPYCT